MPPKPPQPDGQDLWNKVARTVTPLKHGSSRPAREPGPVMMRVPTSGAKSFRRSVSGPRVNMDRKTRRGRVDIRAKIDLHDMRLDQAELALHGALVRAAAAQIPVLLVITGKGVRLEGKIRQAFPGWISSPAMNEYVASYAQAHIRHGGTGAWYIFLRTPKPRAE